MTTAIASKVAPAKAPTEGRDTGAARATASTAQASLGNANMQLVCEALRAGGDLIESATRFEMERRFGRDFTGVRVHTDPAANDSAIGLGARAFAVGSDIVFSEDAFAPQTVRGEALLAHELTHVAQQGFAPMLARTAQEATPQSTESAEAQAQVAEHATGNPSATVSVSPAAPAVACALFGPDLTERQKADQALKSQDPGDVKAIKDVGVTTEDEKIQLLHTLAYQTWAGVRDEWKIEEIWRSFADDAPRVMEANQALWQKCVDKGADLDELPAVKKRRVDFMTDVQELAQRYLDANREYIIQEMSDLGIGNVVPAPTEEQDKRVNEIQDIAVKIKQAQDLQWKLRGVKVGDEYEIPQDGFPFWRYQNFDPEKPPDRNLDEDEHDKDRDWRKVKEVYDPLENFILSVANQYPAIYAALSLSDTYVGGENKVADIGAAQNPAAAREVIYGVLRETLNNINHSETAIMDNDPDYRDLIPLHTQLLTGVVASPSKTDWKSPFNAWVVADDLKGHEAHEFWVRLGLKSLAAAAVVVAEIATVGTATFFIAAGVGLATTGGMAIDSYEKYKKLEEASKTNVKAETAIVDKATVAAAGQKAIDDALAFIMAVIAVGVKVASSIASKGGAGKGGGEGEGGEGGGGVVARKETGMDMVQRLRAAGKKAQVNIGGEANPKYESPDDINLTLYKRLKAEVPNTIQDDAANIASHFEPNSIDSVVGNKLDPGIGWNRAAPGMFKVLKPGGTVNIWIHASETDAIGLEKALLDAGFKDVSRQSIIVTATKP